jgi:hypothetical protein
MRIRGFLELTSRKCRLYSNHLLEHMFLISKAYRRTCTGKDHCRLIASPLSPPFSLSPFGFARNKLEGEGKGKRGWEANLGSAH